MNILEYLDGIDTTKINDKKLAQLLENSKRNIIMNATMEVISLDEARNNIDAVNLLWNSLSDDIKKRIEIMLYPSIAIEKNGEMYAIQVPVGVYVYASSDEKSEYTRLLVKEAVERLTQAVGDIYLYSLTLDTKQEKKRMEIRYTSIVF